MGEKLDSYGGVLGSYSLRVQIGEQDITTSPLSYTSIDIIEYIDRFLPAFTVTFKDPTGFLMNRWMLDSQYGTMTFRFASALEPKKEKLMTFKVYRRFPTAYTPIATTIKVNGLLDVKNLFSPMYQRGWVDMSLSVILDDICKDLSIRRKDVDLGLETPISIVQPNWTNAQFLKYLTRFVLNRSEDAGYFSYVDVPIRASEGEDIRFRFRSLSSFLEQGSVRELRMAKVAPSKETLPIYDLKVVDNFEALGVLGIGKQPYSYFDYEHGKQVDEEIELSEVKFKSLSEYINYCPVSEVPALYPVGMGRTTPIYTPEDIKQSFMGRYYKRINSLVKVWVDTRGVTDVSCGDIVKIVWEMDSEADVKHMNDYLYLGYWMVERIIHHMSSFYSTRLLLTRPGVDAMDTTLYKARRTYGKVLV